MSSRKLQDKKRIEREKRAEELQLLFKLFGENPSTKELFLELNTSEEPGRSEIFLLPGREGCGCIFTDLAKYLKVPAVSIQYDNTNPEKNLSIEQMTDDIFPHFMERHKNRRDFFIVAYSFGAGIGIELARKLEAKGFTGKLVIIDSSPKFLDVVIEERIAGTNEDEIETSWLVHVSQLFAPRLAPTLPDAVKGCKSWDEKVDIFLKSAPADMCGVTPEELRTLYNVMYVRTKGGTTYTKQNYPPIDTPILLIKATYKTIRKSIGEDYGLSSVTKGRVNVREVKDGHVTIVSNPVTASIINAEWESLCAQSV